MLLEICVHLCSTNETIDSNKEKITITSILQLTYLQLSMNP